MRGLKVAVIILTLLVISTTACGSMLLGQLDSVSGFPVMTNNSVFNLFDNSIFPGFSGTSNEPGTVSLSPVSFNNPFSSTPSISSGFTGMDSFSPMSFSLDNTATDIGGADTSLASSSGPMEVNLTYLYTASSPADEYLYVDSLHGSGVTVATHPTGQALQALELVSSTSLYKQYTQYPHTPWRYLDLSGGGYAAGTVDLTTEICPNFPSGASDPSQWYNASAPASGELFFCINVYTGQILNQNFNSYQDVM
jgi:hypothetical protein